jgi:hypothetical protein
MLLDLVVKGSTDRSVVLRIIDSADGTPETGVVFNTAGIDLWYRREGAAKTSITEATLSALTDAHSDGGFLHISDGYYRLDLPDAAIATSAQYVDIGGTVTGMVVIGGRVRLVDANIEVALATASALSTLDGKVDTVDNLLDTEIGDIIAALVILDDFMDTELAAILADTNELQVDWVNGGRLDLLIDAIKAKTDSLTFTVAGLIDSNLLRINGTAAPAVQLAAHAIGALRLVVDAGSSTTEVVFKTVDGATASAVNDFYNGRFIVFTSGALAGQATSISDYVGATKTATVVALTGAPAEDVTAIIV